MMRGIGTIDGIAAQSTAGVADVVDFINAYHALGYVECEAMLPVTAPNDRSGLLERVANRCATDAREVFCPVLLTDPGRVTILPRLSGAIAQLGERYNGIVEVAGSIPAGSTRLGPILRSDFPRFRCVPIV